MLLGDKEQNKEKQVDNFAKASNDIGSIRAMLDTLKDANKGIVNDAKNASEKEFDPDREAVEQKVQQHKERMQRKPFNVQPAIDEEIGKKERIRRRKVLEERLREERRREAEAKEAAAIDEAEREAIRRETAAAIEAAEREAAAKLAAARKEVKRIAAERREAERREEERRKAEKRAKEAERRRAAEELKLQMQRRREEAYRAKEKEKAAQREKKEQAEREYRELKREIEEKRREEKKERSEKARRERLARAEIRRQKKAAKKSAEMGGGIVKVHGTEVSTELHPVPGFSWHDLVGYIKFKDRKSATSQEEKDKLKEEADIRKNQARETAAKLSALRREKRKNNPVRLKLKAFGSFCDSRKKELIIGFSILLTFVIITGMFFNNYTAYEYSYNGKTLGYVKNKDDVLQITDMVREALTKEKNQEVIIDARDDIDFKRRFVFEDEVTIDTQETVLKRLTYMGDLNVKAYGIYIDGKKVGAVSDEKVAAEVLSDIKDKYVSGKNGSTVLEAVITDDIEIKESNTDIEDIMTREEMVNTLCTSGTKEVTHTVVVGETLSDIATDYGLTEKDIMATNDNIDPKKLEVGRPLLIKQKAPLLSVKVTEERTYDKTVKYDVEEKKSKELYKGTKKVERKGENGKITLKEKTVYVNGEVSDNEVLEETVKKEPVSKIVVVGTAKTPPTTGTGTYIWPTKANYRISSRFGPRWGRNHDGIDMACSTGSNVIAADGGTVIEAGYHGSYGNLVVIDHQNGVHTYYAHNSKLLVSVGDKVYQGEHIAESGSTGRSTGPHIHFGVKVNGTFKNPESYLP